MRRLLYALVLIALASHSAAMTLANYIATLERIQSLVLAHQYAAAKTAAQSLHGQVIDSPKGRFNADETIVAALAAGDRVDPRFATRLATTIAELRAASGAATVRDPDMTIVDAIEKEQRVVPTGGGGGGDVSLEPSNRVLGVGTAIEDAFKRIGKWIEELIDWFDSFWPDSDEKEKKPGNIRDIVITIAVGIVVIIILLAWTALRRGRRARPELATSVAMIPSARDEDPLSRASAEWEQYAAQLAAAGQFREAIRAWYHAVLVTLYSASILHFRKGRTNWEYIAALSPSLAWRTRFIALTRRFEYEWYGGTESTAEAFDDCSREARAILGALARPVRGAA
ncbi:MAG TPA: DUF4129 domain-containing protein [Thermoanaerobaculia bacterium]|nr:DUF4129 domain-containing protein [Thermoanaerobaculia bacterium]